MNLYDRVNREPKLLPEHVVNLLESVGFQAQIVPSIDLLIQERELSEYVETLADLFYGESIPGGKYAEN